MVLGFTNSSGGKVVAFVVKAQTCCMAAAYVFIRLEVFIVGKYEWYILSFSVKVSGYSCARTNGSTSERFIALGVVDRVIFEFKSESSAC